jgi:hypothetical protein
MSTVKISYTDCYNKPQSLEVELLAKNERVLVCKVAGKAIGPCYLHYHTATGWRDLDHGQTEQSKQIGAILQNPFELFN